MTKTAQDFETKPTISPTFDLSALVDGTDDDMITKMLGKPVN